LINVQFTLIVRYPTAVGKVILHAVAEEVSAQKGEVCSKSHLYNSGHTGQSTNQTTEKFPILVMLFCSLANILVQSEFFLLTAQSVETIV
jgi:hypothetical protein